MTNYGLEFHFNDISEEQFYSRDDSRVSVLSGTNNCGKTLLLKELFNRFGEEAYLCGINRYYSVGLFSRYSEDPKYIPNAWNNLRTTLGDVRENRDPIALPFQEVFIRLTDDEPYFPHIAVAFSPNFWEWQVTGRSGSWIA